MTSSEELIARADELSKIVAELQYHVAMIQADVHMLKLIKQISETQ
jgi:hypothetical protein